MRGRMLYRSLFPSIVLSKSELDRTVLEVRKENGLYGKYYVDFNAFKTAIDTCILNSLFKDKEKLDTLLTLNFQSFENAQLYTA